MLARFRIWLPDAPGILGAVAAEIGAADGNVIGLEVLERAPGVAIDELVVELPDRPGAVDAVSKGIHTVAGAGVDEVRELASTGQDREDTVLGAAAAILQAATPTASLNAAVGAAPRPLRSQLDRPGRSWSGRSSSRGTATSRRWQWVDAFVEGRAAGPTRPTTPSAPACSPSPIAETRFHVCGGRSAALRRRERHEIAMLVMVAARFIDALGGRELAP